LSTKSSLIQEFCSITLDSETILDVLLLSLFFYRDGL